VGRHHEEDCVKFTRRMTASLLASTLLAGSVAGCDASDDAGRTAEVVIAADLELSGSGAVIGTAYERALALKVAQVNASGVLGGRKLTLKVADNHSDPTTALRNISTFGDDPAVAAIVAGSCSECIVGATKTINDKRVPTIALAPADQVATPVADRRYVFKLAPNSADSAAALVSELKRVRAKRVAVLHSDDLYGRGGESAMRAELTKAGIAVTATSKVRPTDNDITQAVGTLTDTEPDALVVWTFANQATLTATAAKKDAFAGRVYFDAAAAGELFLPREAARATDNATMVFTQILVIDDVIATTPAKAARKQWFRDYTSRYGSYSGVAAFAADAVELISNAVARVGGDRNRIREVLETSQIDGLSGPIRLTPDNHSGLMPQALSLLVARSGRWRLAG
jgi:branched-chain amino acid transport system substrate-binding protein